MHTIHGYRGVLWIGIFALSVILSGCGPQTATVRDADACTTIVQPGESIQAAIDRAPDGAVICLANGTWDESLRIDRSVTLRGQGKDLTVIRSGRFGQPAIWITQGSVHLEDISWVGGSGGGLVSSPPSAALSATGTSTVSVIRCRLADSFPCGVFLADQVAASLEDSELTNNTQYGLVVIGEARAEMTGCLVSGNKDGGVWVSDAAQVDMVDAQLTRNQGPGVWVRDDGRVLLSSCTIDRSQGAGVLAYGSAQVTLERSTLSANWDPGVQLFDRTVLNISESALRSNWHGIELLGSSQAYVERCQISKSRWDAVRVGGSAVLQITASRIEDSLRGIAVTGGATARIQDSFLERCRSVALYAVASDVSGSGNAFSANGVDLFGDIDGGIRRPLQEAAETQVEVPHPSYATLQDAVDALAPGGRLVLREGTFVAGIVLDKRIFVTGEPGATLSARDPQAPVLSLVKGADVEISGVRLTGGSEGVAAAADARVTLIDCALAENETGLGLWSSSLAVLLRTEIVANRQVGAWIWDDASARIEDCTLIANSRGAVGVGGRAQLILENSLVERNGRPGSESWGGILLMGTAHAEFIENRFVSNDTFGIATYGSPCIGRGKQFFGQISGRDNVFAGNAGQPVCPGDVMLSLSPPGAPVPEE